MATVTLKLEVDPVTKKKNVIIKYDSDSDALPMEHEEQHKKIVEALIAGGTVKATDLGTITVTRESGEAAKGEEKKPEGQKAPVANKG